MRYILLSLFFLFTTNSFSQKIDAADIAEWKNPKKLSSDYHYNSASIYLVNGSLLPDLFSGATLTKSERKKHNLRAKDYAKAVFLSVEMAHPKNKETLTIPLYLLDVTNKNNQQFSSANMGRVLDEIKDEDLNFKPLYATGKIKAIKGNSTDEFMAQSFEIATALFRTALVLKEGPLGTNEILQNVQKGAEYFNKIAQNKTISNEFKIPIIKESDVYKYEIYSVSVHQIKWDFEENEGDVLAEIKDKEQSIEQILELLSKNKKPYLVLARYKSYYTLPKDYIKSVEIDQNYVNTRQTKLIEFSGMKKELEATLLENLKEAITMKKDFQVYSREKEINQTNYDAISRLMNSYYIIMERYKEEISKNESDSQRKAYFEENYQEAYGVLFSKLEEYINSDLKSAKNIVDKYLELSKKDFSKMNESDLCSNLQSMEYYRDIIQKQQNSNKSIIQITNSKFYPKYSELVTKIENSLYTKSFDLDKFSSNDEKINYLNSQMLQFPCCAICKEKANLIITKINNDNDNARKGELLKLQREYLNTLKCWEEISKIVFFNMQQKFPITEREQLSSIDQKIFQGIEKQYQNIMSSSNNYLSINDIDISNLTSKQLINNLNKYIIIKRTVSQSIEILVNQKLINEKDCECSKG